MRKMHPDRKDPIYCILRSELRRSERALNQSLYKGENIVRLVYGLTEFDLTKQENMLFVPR